MTSQPSKADLCNDFLHFSCIYLQFWRKRIFANLCTINPRGDIPTRLGTRRSAPQSQILHHVHQPLFDWGQPTSGQDEENHDKIHMSTMTTFGPHQDSHFLHDHQPLFDWGHQPTSGQHQDSRVHHDNQYNLQHFINFLC